MITDSGCAAHGLGGYPNSVSPSQPPEGRKIPKSNIRQGAVSYQQSRIIGCGHFQRSGLANSQRRATEYKPGLLKCRTISSLYSNEFLLEVPTDSVNKNRHFLK